LEEGKCGKINFVESFEVFEKLNKELKEEFRERKREDYWELLLSLGEERREKIEAEKIRRIQENKKKKKHKPKLWSLEQMMKQ
jgi:hypothetical protein